MSVQVKKLVTYPIKGLSGQVLPHVELHKKRGFPMDRAFGFSRYDSGMDIANPRPMPKSKFLVLARDAALARLKTRFDTDTQTFFVQDSETSLVFDLSEEEGINQASTYLSGVVGLAPDKRPDFVRGGDIRFTDVCMSSLQMMHAVSIINLASVRELSDKIGQEVDPERFRGNILIDGLPAFAELDMLEKEFRVGGAQLRILKRTQRCPATQVNLDTAKRDLDIPALLDEHYGHRDMGVYAEVTVGGAIKNGDALAI